MKVHLFFLTSCILLVSLILSPSRASALDGEYFSPRNQNAGGTGISWASGIDAVFLNPANLSKTTYLLQGATLASPYVIVSRDTFQIAKEVYKKDDRFEIIAKHQDTPQHITAGNTVGIAFRRAALVFQYQNSYDAFVGYSLRTGRSQFDYSNKEQGGVYFAVANGFFSNMLQIGITTKVIQKKTNQVSLSLTEAQNKIDNKTYKSALSENQKRGFGVGADTGLTWLISDKNNKPTLALVTRNLGLKYTSAKKGNLPDKDLATLNAGFSLEPGTRSSSSRISIDYLDLFEKTKEPAYKRVRLGAELNFMGFLGFAGGMFHGYPTYGAFLNLRLLKLEGGTYSEELGMKPGTLRDRRYYAKASVGWSR